MMVHYNCNLHTAVHSPIAVEDAITVPGLSPALGHAQSVLTGRDAVVVTLVVFLARTPDHVPGQFQATFTSSPVPV